MTRYEAISLIISGIALMIPIVQWIWKKYIVKAQLNHYQTGYAYLYNNKSGSYIRIQSVFEAENKPISIKGISLCVTRERDNQQRNYIWSTFSSPTNMQFVGNNASAYEIAHPFRIEADNVYCAFTEYADKNQSAFRMLSPLFSLLVEKAKEIRSQNIPYDQAVTEYLKTEEYRKASQTLDKELFWQIGNYTAIICAQYQKTTQTFTLSFEVTSEQATALQQNMKECLISPLKEA